MFHKACNHHALFNEVWGISCHAGGPACVASQELGRDPACEVRIAGIANGLLLVTEDGDMQRGGARRQFAADTWAAPSHTCPAPASTGRQDEAHLTPVITLSWKYL